MGRLQLFEFEDQPWFPARIRGYMVDFLTFMSTFGGDVPYRPLAERLAPAFESTGATRFVELAAGSGGPGTALSRVLASRLGRDVGLVLTDLYPNVESLRAHAAPGVVIVETSVDATAVPAGLAGFRLICNAFHHLSPDQGRAVLRDAVSARQGVCIVEFAERSVAGMAQIAAGVLGMMLVTPFVKPFSLGRMFFTYAIPIVPLATAWDGFVSGLRIYDPGELAALVAGVPDQALYTWHIEAFRVAPAPARITVLVGYPKA